jgi:hypothetical protein
MAIGLGTEARVPKAEAPNPQTSDNVFSTPDDHPGAAPVFLAPNGRPLSTTQPYRMPDLRNLTQLPALSLQQRNRMNQIVDAFNRHSGQIRQEMGAVQQEIDSQKKSVNIPDDKTQQRQSEPKQLLEQLRRQMADDQGETFATLYGMLDDSQRKDYDAMRHGALVVEPINPMPHSAGTTVDTGAPIANKGGAPRGSWVSRLFHHGDR